MTTYGEFIKTKAAQAEADSHVRRYINDSLKQLKGSRLVKYARGAPGSLDYGRVVVMLAIPPGEMAVKLAEMRNHKPKDTVWVLHADFGKMTRLYGNVHHPVDNYRLKTAADRKYNEYLKFFLGRR